ncbi:zinc finger protein 26 [Scaptodrosophila lebanonensis]|uniref:Zinc finger protein 26 n=1 Tax=Drosophila lebanonensis TaxID=7225 RepID=A0A6J2T8M8_DROLE|nr:zinc finger protein 26 [Scaptodrosophila lebanonensis]
MQVQIQAKVKPIGVPVYELPQYLCVETKVLNDSVNSHTQDNIPIIDKGRAKMLGLIDDQEEKNSPVELMCSCTQTLDPLPPRRDRFMQSDVKTTKEVAIQCNRDGDEEISEITDPVRSDPVERLESEAEFLSFVSEHTNMYPNGMLECLFCGDVSIALQPHQHHMAMHYGPKSLCASCGKQVDQGFLRQHLYECSAQLPKIRWKCPYFSCSSVAQSKRQLNAHIKRHGGLINYRCLKCRRGFATILSFLMHRYSSDLCHKAKLGHLCNGRILFGKRTFNLRQCSVCYKRFSNERVCARHRAHCLRRHQANLQRRLFKPPKTK